MATLLCKQCNYENEAERIYCHNCGAKLDRSVLPVDKKKQQETPEKARRRVKKMTTPDHGFFAAWPKKLISCVLWAAVFAGAIQASRPPDGIPPMPAKGALNDAPPIAMKLEEAVSLRAAQQIVISEPLINGYLLNTVKSHGGGTFEDYVKFDRAFVNLTEGNCHITSQQSAFGYPFYAGSAYRLAIENNHLAATSLGGNLGRLPVHPLIMQYADLLFQRLWDALKRERKLLDGMQSIRVERGQITLTTRSGLPPH